MKIYLAGPMRGYPLFNFPAFEEATSTLRMFGHEVWSPAENDVEHDGFDPAKDPPRTMSHYMERDLPAICRSEAIALLPGWEKSEGCAIEVWVARKLEKLILLYHDGRLSVIDDMVPTGIGGARIRATTLPTDAKDRKAYPVASGCLDYFPDALAAIAHLSHIGNEQHNPGKPLHWDRSKSTDESDTMIRHFLQRGMKDSDGVSHTTKMAWRALALLQKEIEAQ